MRYRVGLTREICDMITNARIDKILTKTELANIISKPPSWVTKVEKFQVYSITRNDALLLENALGISLTHTNAYYNEKLVRRITELEEENRRLKELLMEKWKKEISHKEVK